MPEDVARAVGAEAPDDDIVINGKICRMRPLGIKELCEVERECLKQYVRSYLEVYKNNLDLLPGVDGQAFLQSKMEEVAKWDTNSLPLKLGCDARRVKVTPDAVAWVKANYGVGDSPPGAETEGAEVRRIARENYFRRLISASVDNGMISAELYQTLTGEKAPLVKIPYVNWWITGCMDGMITFIWIAFRTSDVTKDEVASALGNNPALLVHLSRELERLSAPKANFG